MIKVEVNLPDILNKLKNLFLGNLLMHPNNLLLKH
jgi:hypothetical protein